MGNQKGERGEVRKETKETQPRVKRHRAKRRPLGSLRFLCLHILNFLLLNQMPIATSQTASTAAERMSTVAVDNATNEHPHAAS